MKRTRWDAESRLEAAVLVDVDGTLVGPYREGTRQLRPTAARALSLLSGVIPVFLWSIVGAENGWRLVREFPEIAHLVEGCYGKDDFPLHLVETAYAIDDEDIDESVRGCEALALVDTYDGSHDSGLLLEAAHGILALVSSGQV